MPRHILLVIACLANDTDSGPDDKMMKMFTLGCRTVQSFAKLRLVSLVYHCLSLASNRRHTALYKYIYIYSEIMDYAGGIKRWWITARICIH